MNKILEMIESADPEDKEGLDELDICVAEYIKLEDADTQRRQGYTWVSYSRSHDAAIGLLPLKLAWGFENHGKGFSVDGCMGYVGRWHNQRAICPTLPLGILHLAVQAIERESNE